MCIYIYVMLASDSVYNVPYMYIYSVLAEAMGVVVAGHVVDHWVTFAAMQPIVSWPSRTLVHSMSQCRPVQSAFVKCTSHRSQAADWSAFSVPPDRMA